MPSRVASTIQGAVTSSPTTTAGIDTTGAHALRVWVHHETTGTPTISDSKGNTWAHVGTQIQCASTGAGDSYNSYVDAFEATGTVVVGTAHTFTSTLTNGYSTIEACAVKADGVGAILSFGSWNAQLDTATPWAAASDSPTTDALIIAFGCDSTTNSAAAYDWTGSGFTKIDAAEASGAWHGTLATRSVTAGTYTASFTGAASSRCVVGTVVVTEYVPQIAYPNADVTDGAWTPSTGADLFAVLDDSSDADYITTNSNSTFRVGLAPLDTPIAGTQTLAFRASGSPAKKLIVTLIESSGTSRGTLTIDPLPAVPTAYSFAPSGVTNWGDLDVSGEIADATSPPSPSVSFGAIGTGVNGSTSINVGVPSGITAGDYLTLHVTSGATNSETPNTPSGWTLLATGASTDGTFGVDTGPRRATVFGKVAGASEGAVTVTTTNGNTVRGTMSRWSLGHAGYSWDVVAQGANDSTSGTGVSMTTASIDWAAGDCAAVVVGQRVDSATQSAQSLTASGTTFGTRTNRATTAVTTGNDHRHVVDTFAAVTTGGGSAATTWSYTASAAVSAGGVIVRLREVPPTEFGRVYTTKLTIPEAYSGGGTGLTVQEASHAHTADNVVLTTDSLLAIQDATHAHAAEEPGLTTATLLAIADALHSHLADNVTLSTAVDTALVIAEALHAHSAESPTLAVASVLTIADATHAHLADSLSLTTDALLVITDAGHSHLADNVVLSVSNDIILAIADALHAHAAEAVALTTTELLIIQEALHAHAADNVVLVATSVFYLSEAEIDAIVTAILDLDIPAATPAAPVYGTGTLSAEERAMIAYKFATRVIP